jgi:hypothetical protein
MDRICSTPGEENLADGDQPRCLSYGRTIIKLILENVMFLEFGGRCGWNGFMQFTIPVAILENYGEHGSSRLEQWYSTWGTRRHLTGYVQFKKYNNNIFVM